MAIRTGPSPNLIAARRRALEVLAASPNGCSRRDMYQQGFPRAVLGHLVVTRLATSTGRGISARLSITEAGRKEIGRGGGDG